MSPASSLREERRAGRCRGARRARRQNQIGQEHRAGVGSRKWMRFALCWQAQKVAAYRRRLGWLWQEQQTAKVRSRGWQPPHVQQANTVRAFGTAPECRVGGYAQEPRPHPPPPAAARYRYAVPLDLRRSSGGTVHPGRESFTYSLRRSRRSSPTARGSAVPTHLPGPVDETWKVLR